MALTDFYGWTEAELLAGLKSAQNDLSRGKILVSTGAGDINSASQLTNNAKERLRMFQRALYELDPTTYAAFDLVGHSQTTAVFRQATVTD